MIRVLKITTDGTHGRKLYQAAGRVFTLPRFDTLMTALKEPDKRFELLSHFYSMWDYDNHYLGPDISFAHRWDNTPTQAIIYTEASDRQITVDFDETVWINFHEGSVTAAGKIIALLRELEDDAYLILAQDTEGGLVNLYGVHSYPGPVHKELDRARWDERYHHLLQAQ